MRLAFATDTRIIRVDTKLYGLPHTRNRNYMLAWKDGTYGKHGALDVGDAWEEIELAVDSGATETVVPDESLARVDVEEGAAFRRGVKYEVANGVMIPNLGEKTFTGVTEEGHSLHHCAGLRGE